MTLAETYTAPLMSVAAQVRSSNRLSNLRPGSVPLIMRRPRGRNPWPPRPEL